MSAPAPPTAGGADDLRRHAPATLRNRAAILAVLREAAPARGTVLEVASGSGEHAAWFAAALPGLTWQPSDPDPAARASIAAWCAGLANVSAPLALDARQRRWPVAGADALLCINMIHIAPWSATMGLFRGAAQLLCAGAPLLLYGPFVQAGVATAPSNLAFDRSLPDRDAGWGLRALDRVTAVAARHGFAIDRVVAMPANNLCVLWRREATAR